MLEYRKEMTFCRDIREWKFASDDRKYINLCLFLSLGAETMLFERLGNYKFAFSELEDALDFYNKLGSLPISTHIVKGRVWEELQELYFVNVISREDKDSEADFLSRLALSYESFVYSGCKDCSKEFDYLPGYKIIKERDPKVLRRFHD